MRRQAAAPGMLARLVPLGLVGALAGAPAAGAAELRPRTLAAFERYLAATEARIATELADEKTFLHVDALDGKAASEARRQLDRGEVWMARLETRDDRGKVLRAPDGLIHHWVGAVRIPGTSLAQVLDRVRDYDRHQEIYPEVLRSRLLGRDGEQFRILLRLKKKKVITVILDTEHEVRYVQVNERHWWSRSEATRIAEVDDAGTPGERIKPPGEDRGFLWRMVSIWRFAERDGAVAVECESVSLTRDIPAAVSWLVKPFVTSIPEESLRSTLGGTRDAVLAR